MSTTGMNRRQFLESGGRTVLGGAAATIGTGAGGCTKRTTVLDQHALDTLAAMAQRLYPHDQIGILPYEDLALGLAENAARDETLRGLLLLGVRGLDKEAVPEAFAGLDPEGQLAILSKQDGSEFFSTVRNHVVTALYKDERVWPKLGYEGPSFPFGGYLERGFDDIDWLPEA